MNATLIKSRKESNIYSFGGNRIKTLERDNYTCVKCEHCKNNQVLKLADQVKAKYNRDKSCNKECILDIVDPDHEHEYEN